LSSYRKHLDSEIIQPCLETGQKSHLKGRRSGRKACLLSGRWRLYTASCGGAGGAIRCESVHGPVTKQGQSRAVMLFILIFRTWSLSPCYFTHFVQFQSFEPFNIPGSSLDYSLPRHSCKGPSRIPLLRRSQRGAPCRSPDAVCIEICIIYWPWITPRLCSRADARAPVCILLSRTKTRV
jgi:hypothetical protein